MKRRIQEGKRVILRVDFNVPIINGKIIDDFRIRASISTIRGMVVRGAQVFLITHLEQDGLIPHLDLVAKRLSRLLKIKIKFVKGDIPQQPQVYSERVILFDNIRLYQEEKNNDRLFAQRLSRWGDYYVNDAFSAMHRTHASIVGIPKFLPGSLGPLVRQELKQLSKLFQPAHPFIFVLGGKKFDTKEPLIKKFLQIADYIFVCGALANSFLSQRGVFVGKSSVDRARITKKILWHPKIILPSDVVVLRNGRHVNVPVHDVARMDTIFDIGGQSVARMIGQTASARFILWNGTLGVCEAGFADGTKKFVAALGRAKAYRIVGGGDTVAAIHKFKMDKNFDFVSTGGGAMLEFLARGTLPGILAVEKSRFSKNQPKVIY